MSPHILSIFDIAKYEGQGYTLFKREDEIVLALPNGDLVRLFESHVTPMSAIEERLKACGCSLEHSSGPNVKRFSIRHVASNTCMFQSDSLDDIQYHASNTLNQNMLEMEASAKSKTIEERINARGCALRSSVAHGESIEHVASGVTMCVSDNISDIEWYAATMLGDAVNKIERETKLAEINSRTNARIDQMSPVELKEFYKLTGNKDAP
jgi:hypothetical protein